MKSRIKISDHMCFLQSGHQQFENWQEKVNIENKNMDSTKRLLVKKSSERLAWISPMAIEFCTPVSKLTDRNQHEMDLDHPHAYNDRGYFLEGERRGEKAIEGEREPSRHPARADAGSSVIGRRYRGGGYRVVVVTGWWLQTWL